MKKIFSGILVVVFALSSSFSAYSKKCQWNTWSDRESVLLNLKKATDEGKTYFSNFKYYDYTKYDDLLSSRMASDLGFPFLYGVDLYQAFGNYLPKEKTQPQKRNIAKTVRAAWEKNHAIPLISWHLHSPYAVYSDFKKAMGCRYTHNVEGYPQNHRYVINEILNHKQVDTLGIGNIADWFDEQIKEVADFINTEFIDKKGKPIPLIFRLWHEQQDSWAWWCYAEGKKEKSHVSIPDYKAFWRLTVEKFRTYCPNAQIIWCYGPDRYFSSAAEYMKTYPGDDVVDILAYDDYRIGYTEKFESPEHTLEANLKPARIVTKQAEEHGKIAIIAETNCPNKNYKDSFFDYVQAILTDDECHIAVFQMWSMSYFKEPTTKFVLSPNIIFDR